MTMKCAVTTLDNKTASITQGVSSILPAGRNTKVWNVKRVRAGIYVCGVEIDGVGNFTGKIIVEK